MFFISVLKKTIIFCLLQSISSNDRENVNFLLEAIQCLMLVVPVHICHILSIGMLLEINLEKKDGVVYLLKNIPWDTTMEKMAQGRSLHKFLVDIHYLIVSNFDLKHLSQIFE